MRRAITIPPVAVCFRNAHVPDEAWPKETTMEASTSLPARPGPTNRFRDAPRSPDFTIDQDWASYSAAEHDRWDRLFRHSVAALQGRACDEFRAMVKALDLSDG